ncbi:MAG TPA: DUF2764 domain-containing protein [Methylococcus sp.]|nr:DUF2764 domain-containing protein [Methylococcus sp.]
MVARADRYIQLLGSLPAHPRHLFASKQEVISRLQLDRRLRLLEPEDGKRLRAIEGVVYWERLSPEVGDRELVARGKSLLACLDNPFLEELVLWRLEVRTAIACLRRRQLNMNPPSGSDWGHGRWLQRMRAHWSDPALGLERVFPWLPEAAALLQGGEFVALEKLLLEQCWNHYRIIEAGHYFDFEAVVLYVLRWDVIARWTRYDGATARERFRNLAKQGLAKQASTDPLPGV